MAKILLVEDNDGIAQGLTFAFEMTDHNFKTVSNLKEARAIVESDCPGLVLLDVSLPDGNGFDFYKTYLGPKGLSVIFLTAKDDESDIVNGLELGAEDYITKPFSTRELMARVNRVLLRKKSTTCISAGNVSFDMDKSEVRRDGELVTLSSLELKIVKLLFENHDRIVSRNSVIECIWEATGNDVFDHTVTVYMKRIREKLGEDVIITVKGAGYRIDTK